MVHRFFVGLLLLLCFACNGQIEELAPNASENPSSEKTDRDVVRVEADTPSIRSLRALQEISDKGQSYPSVKRSVQVLLADLQQKAISQDSLSALFEHQLLRRVIPFWEGTPWSFEGHTAKPEVGEIACGYFVSTTLRDVGVVVNRYKLAQQSPINEAKSLAVGEEVLLIETFTPEEGIRIIKDTLSEGLFFIGFDASHVGYLWKHNNEVYLIHSNYLRAEGVIIEKIGQSEVFAAYRRFYVVGLSNNATLLKKWIQQSTIPILSSN